jgi:hypothetical protein
MDIFPRDSQAEACRRLLSAVVVVALRDACSVPPKRGVGGMPISTDAFTAMRFFFDTSVSGLNEYLAWFDIDAGQYRRRLKEVMWDSSAHRINGFESMDRRNFRYNYRMWEKLRDNLPLDFNEEEND